MASMTTTPTTTPPLPKLSKNQKKKLFKAIQMDTESNTLLKILTQHLGTTNPDTISIFIQQLHGSGNNETLLHRSCAHGAVENTRFLLPYFLPHHIDIRNSQMKTPLHEACTCGSVDIVSMLLQAGALKDAQFMDTFNVCCFSESFSSCCFVHAIGNKYIHYKRSEPRQYDSVVFSLS